MEEKKFLGYNIIQAKVLIKPVSLLVIKRI